MMNNWSPACTRIDWVVQYTVTLLHIFINKWSIEFLEKEPVWRSFAACVRDTNWLSCIRRGCWGAEVSKKNQFGKIANRCLIMGLLMPCHATLFEVINKLSSALWLCRWWLIDGIDLVCKGNIIELRSRGGGCFWYGEKKRMWLLLSSFTTKSYPSLW